MNNIRAVIALVVFIATTTLPSCVSLAEYEKGFLNDEDMRLSHSNIEQFELTFQSYREGAAGANGGKTGGGCGCN